MGQGFGKYKGESRAAGPISIKNLGRSPLEMPMSTILPIAVAPKPAEGMGNLFMGLGKIEEFKIPSFKGGAAEKKVMDKVKKGLSGPSPKNGRGGQMRRPSTDCS
jgi:hypothetical protein